MLIEKTFAFRAGRLLLAILLFICCGQQSRAQTEIGGMINQYSRILRASNCPTIIEVSDPQGFTMGQTVLVLAMQSREMVTSNSPDFGRLTSTTAGAYDWTTITAIDGNHIHLAHALSSDYDFSQVVQLVGIPSYDSAVVVSELLPKAWDGNTGGVVALEVRGSLSLRSDINASGYGFRGGVSVQASDDNCNLLTSANAFFYEAGNWRGAPKGEGVVPPVLNREYGRGAQANGGGGANTHNAGGGGGSNRTAGGQGGENREPAFAGCDGFFPGLGGWGLPGDADRWIMGGGGGAGHRNNDSDSSGGNGGGIVVIKAGQLIFEGGQILADGSGGQSAVGDGAGGGGGGGTIVLDVVQVEGGAFISARGGQGGNAVNPGNRCMGPGGGGSGGQVNSTLPLNPMLDGGQAGRSLNSSSCPEGPNGAAGGTDGNFNQLGIKTGTLAAQSPIASFTYELDGLEIVLTNNSEYADNYAWSIGEIPDYASTEAAPLITLPAYGSYELSLLATNSCGTDTVTQILSLGGAPEAAFTADLSGSGCAPALVQWVDQSAGVYDTYFWEFPGGEPATSTSPNPSVLYSTAGTFDVRLTVSGPLGSSTLDKEAVITVFSFPQAEFSYQIANLTVLFNSTGTSGLKHIWTFGDGNTSGEKDPTHTYSEPGVYDVTLNVQNGSCASAITQTLVLVPSANSRQDQLEGVVLSPNPSPGLLRIASRRKEFFPLQIHIFDHSGRLLHQQPVWNEGWIDLSAYADGIYMIYAVSPLGRRGGWRVVKQK